MALDVPPTDAPLNPMHKSRKRKSLRSIDARTRLEILQLVTQKELTASEIALRYSIKAQAVYDLNKKRTLKRNYIIKKKESELK